MKQTRWLLGVSGRWLVPLLMFAFALSINGLRYLHQMGAIADEVVVQETERLRERLSLDQERLELRISLDDRLFLSRLVSSLALHDGVERAYLLDAQGVVRTSLSRLDIGRPLEAVLAGWPQRTDLALLLAEARPAALQVAGNAAGTALVALVPLQAGHRLVVWQDLSRPLAHRRAVVQAEVAREALLVLVALAALSLLLHLLWFRRARHLAQTLQTMGTGNLSVRTGLRGRDELAHIGAEADRMAERLQEEQQRLRHLYELVNRSPLVVIEWRNQPGWPVTYVSESVAIWGYAPADLIAGTLHYNDLFHPDDGPRVNAEVAGYFAHGPDDYRQEYRIRRADGGWAWVDDRTSLQRSPGGEVLSISGVLLDITARKEAEQAQRVQAERLRMFYELPFLGMAISSPFNKRWLQVNDRLCDMLGYTREELLRMTWAEMTPSGDLERNVALFDELLAGQRTGYQMAKRFVRKDGSLVHTEVDVRATRNEAGQVQQLFATLQDVTDRRAAEEALRCSQAQLLEAQRIGRMGSWTLDLRTRAFSGSQETFRIHEVDPVVFDSRIASFMTLVHPHDRQRLKDVYWRSIKERHPYEIRYRICVASGVVKHLHLQGETQYEGNVAVRTVGIVVDETNLVLAQIERDRLASVMETTSDIVSMADPLGRVFYFNRAGYEVLDLPTDAPLDNVIERVHPSWAARRVLAEGIPTAIREGRWLEETAIIDSQGRERPMSQLIMVHRGADGQVEYLWTILRDISERKQAEAALNLERMQLSDAQAVARIGSWTIQMPGGHLSWSAQNFKVLGLDPATTTPSLDAFLAVIHPDDRATVQEQMDRDMARQISGSNCFRHRIVTQQGVRHVEQRASMHVDELGHVTRVLGTTMDITERVLAEQALLDVKDMLEQGEAVGRMGSFAYDSDTRELKWSRQAFATIGLPFSPQPPSVDDYCACIHPEDVQGVRASIDLLVAGAEVPEVSFRTHPDRGAVRWLRRVYQRIDRQSEGKGARYIGTLQDITDAVLAEERLRQTNQQLEERVTKRTAQLRQANQELEAFSYSVSHDLKAPLRGIDGYSQLLAEEYGHRLDEEGLHFVQRIRHGVQLMGDLINDLLAYSRMDRRDMAREPVDLVPLVLQVLEGFEADIQSQGVVVQTTLEPGTLALDREGIAVALRNLVGNAIKFSRDSQPPRIEIGSRREAGRRMLWVRDNGVGFDMKYHDRLFGIFQRLHRAEEFAGTGVGLALVAKAAQRMGGRVWAESAPGAGATFFMEFPE